MKYLTFFLILIIGLTSFTPILAQTPDGPFGDCPPGEFCNPIGSDTISEIIDSIIVGLRDKIAPPLVALMVLVGAFQMLFAGGNPEKFKSGKKTILYTIIGYAIIIVASGISSIITELVS